MPKRTKDDSTVFVVKLQKGLADRQRLPLSHVISVLEELRQMISEAGREIEKDMGIDRPTGDFGLELVAGNSGIVFRKGSVQAHIAITEHVKIGTAAAERIIHTVEMLSSKKPPVAVTQTDRNIIRRLNRIAKVQKADRTELQIIVERPRHKPAAALFGEAAIAAAWTLQAPVMEVEDLTVYGKLYELRDTDPEDEGRKGFWGELRRENGEIWRVQFKASDVDKAVPLFRKQVSLTGTAKYYRIAAPKLIAHEMAVEKERDYESAFDELFGSDKDIYGDDLDSVTREMKGEN
jgi:hypothetical protein